MPAPGVSLPYTPAMKAMAMPCLVFLAVAAWTQAPAATPQFSAASIRPAPSIQQVLASHQTPHAGTKIDAGRVDIGFASLQDLICAAYQVKPYQVSGPDYLSERFDVLATIPPGVSQDEVPAMLQALLRDRFHLAVHHESKTLPVYALIVSKAGAKLTPAAADADAVAAAAQAKAVAAGGTQTISAGDGSKATVTRSADGGGASMSITGGKSGPMRMEMGADGLHLVADRMPLPALADMLTGLAGRPVLDQTGLTGAYQISLAVSRDDLMAMARVQAAKLGMPLPPPAAGGPVAAPAPSGHSIMQAVAKLGLELDAREAPVDTIVVDHADKTPTTN